MLIDLSIEAKLPATFELWGFKAEFRSIAIQCEAGCGKDESTKAWISGLIDHFRPAN